MKVKYPSYPFYDELRARVQNQDFDFNVKEVCDTLNSINDPYINDHMEIIISLVIHHHLKENNGEYSGEFNGLKSRDKFIAINLSQNADQLLVKIICLYFYMNLQK